MAKPSKRVAARQAELSKRKRQHRSVGDGAAAAVDEPATAELNTKTPRPAENTTTPPATIPAATTTGTRAEPLRSPQTPFRQPSFRGPNRTATTLGHPAAPAASGIRRPMPRSPYQGQDLKAIGVVTSLLVVGLIALRLVL